MLKLAIAQRARRDMLSIHTYLAERSPAAAERTVRRLSARFDELLTYPMLGPVRSDLRPGLRGLLIDPYIAFYTVRAGRIVIVRVLDSRMNIKREFSE
ncbi:type II toxin-antitoxin system RelE/ParE family toxin [Tardiphaga sp.]|jgi:toxin ParE1/3/4|uniref:type II toxin-antitoxin system RelE/ParE family toxin n=1 Tax=Tardiphaga sp. TaxID=1926292 RepID=UPI0037D9A2E0